MGVVRRTDNRIGDAGAIAFGDALAMNGAITALDLDSELRGLVCRPRAVNV